ncbi:hypothetical protein BDQ17DRAFT_1415578 [Cyathus striatus]|nr:hypothetical protein BDQ17DRAFT_1415578 [Cyathus striatus]
MSSTSIPDAACKVQEAWDDKMSKILEICSKNIDRLQSLANRWRDECSTATTSGARNGTPSTPSFSMPTSMPSFSMPTSTPSFFMPTPTPSVSPPDAIDSSRSGPFTSSSELYKNCTTNFWALTSTGEATDPSPTPTIDFTATKATMPVWSTSVALSLNNTKNSTTETLAVLKEIRGFILQEEGYNTAVALLLPIIKMFLPFQKDEAIPAVIHGSDAILYTYTRANWSLGFIFAWVCLVGWQIALANRMVILVLWKYHQSTGETSVLEFVVSLGIFSSAASFMWLMYFIAVKLIFPIRWKCFIAHVKIWWEHADEVVSRTLMLKKWYPKFYAAARQNQKICCDEAIRDVVGDMYMCEAQTLYVTHDVQTFIQHVDSILKHARENPTRDFVESHFGHILFKKPTDHISNFNLPRYEETIGQKDINSLWLFESCIVTLHKEQALVDALVAHIRDLYHAISNVRELANDFEQSVIDLALPHLQLWHRLCYGFLTPHPTLYCEAFTKLGKSLKMLADSGIKFVNYFISFDVVPYEARSLSDTDLEHFVSAINETYKSGIMQSFSAKQFYFATIISYLKCHTSIDIVEEPAQKLYDAIDLLLDSLIIQLRKLNNAYLKHGISQGVLPETTRNTWMIDCKACSQFDCSCEPPASQSTAPEGGAIEGDIVEGNVGSVAEGDVAEGSVAEGSVAEGDSWLSPAEPTNYFNLPDPGKIQTSKLIEIEGRNAMYLDSRPKMEGQTPHSMGNNVPHII